MDFSRITEELWSWRTRNIEEYNNRVNPDSRPVLGVGAPRLRRMARAIAAEGYQTFLDEYPETYYEQQLLKAYVLGYAKDDIETILTYADRFVPAIGDWAVNDGFCSSFKHAKEYPERVWNWILTYAVKQKEFSQRMAAVMMLFYYLNEEYIDRVLEWMNQLTHPGYYTRMGVAWCVATAYARCPEQTKRFLENNRLDDWTYHKTIRKMCESYSVPEESQRYWKSRERG